MEWITSWLNKLKKTFSQEPFLGVLVALVVTIFSTWSILPEPMFRVHDYTHGARIAELLRSVEAGHFPPRWTSSFGYGYGMPLYSFYAPLPFMVGAVIFWATNSIGFSVKMLFVLVNFGTALGSWHLGKRLFKQNLLATTVATATITLAPYRALNLFVRGALSEVWGIMAIPWILLFSLELIDSTSKTNRKWTVLKLTLALLVVLLSHNLTTLMVVPTLALATAGLILYHLFKKSPSKRFSYFITMLTWFGFAYVLAVGIASFYLIPALVEKNFTSIESILGGYFDYHHHFLYIRQFFNPTWGYDGSGWGPNDDISFFLGYPQLLSLAGIGLWWLISAFNSLRSKQQFSSVWVMITIVLSITGISLLFSLLKSLWLWEHISVLAFIQFPWRWLSLSVITLGLCAGYGIYLIKNTKVQFLLTVLLISLSLLHVGYFKPGKYLSNTDELYYTDSQRIARSMSSILPDFIPYWLDVEELVVNQELLGYGADSSLERFNSSLSDEQYQVLVDRPHQLMYQFNKIDQTVVIPLALFPGWEVAENGVSIGRVTSNSETLEPAFLNYQEENDSTISFTNEGLYQVQVTPETERISFNYVGSWSVRVANIISLASLAIAVYIYGFKTQQEKIKHD